MGPADRIGGFLSYGEGLQKSREPSPLFDIRDLYCLVKFTWISLTFLEGQQRISRSAWPVSVMLLLSSVRTFNVRCSHGCSSRLPGIGWSKAGLAGVRTCLPGTSNRRTRAVKYVTCRTLSSMWRSLMNRVQYRSSRDVPWPGLQVRVQNPLLGNNFRKSAGDESVGNQGKPSTGVRTCVEAQLFRVP